MIRLENLSSFLLIQLLGIVYTSVLMNKKKKSKKESIIEEVLDEIHQKWNLVLYFESIAAKQMVSYAWSRKAFKTVTGTSPNQYQLMRKISKANSK